MYRKILSSPLQGAREGITDICAMATASEIQQVVISALKPKLEKLYSGFQYNWATLTVRELKNWNDLATYRPSAPVFYDRCMHEAKTKDKKPQFKKPSTPFEIGWVIDYEQWDEIQEYRVCRYCLRLQHH